MPAIAPSRFGSRLRVVPRALARNLLGPRARPTEVRRVLVAHHLLAGDVLMLAPLLAKLRAVHPAAEVDMTVRKAMLRLFDGRPFGVRALAYDPRDATTLDALCTTAGYDVAYVPGDNRYSWLAAAAGARWIVAFEGDRPRPKSWPVDETRSYRDRPAAWGDMVADLVDGPAPAPMLRSDWPRPRCAPFDRPQGCYAVLHVEASTPLKHWEPAKWWQLAERLSEQGLHIVWSAGPGGEPLLADIDPQGRYLRLGHRLDLAQLWHLVADAALLVCPDTSVMHIGRLVATPTVALYGPSATDLFGPGDFLRGIPYRAITIPDFPCRDQNRLFKRELAWVRRCQRSTRECDSPRCMHAIGVDQVAETSLALVKEVRARCD